MSKKILKTLSKSPKTFEGALPKNVHIQTRRPPPVAQRQWDKSPRLRFKEGVVFLMLQLLPPSQESSPPLQLRSLLRHLRHMADREVARRGQARAPCRQQNISRAYIRVGPIWERYLLGERLLVHELL